MLFDSTVFFSRCEVQNGISFYILRRKPNVVQNAKPKISMIVADDHPIIRRYLKRVLRDYFDIEPFIETNDGSELLESIDKTVPDLAVIDLAMPEINGYDAILKIHTQYPEIKTVVFSGFLTPETQQRVIQLGAHSTISKNETPDAIINAFRTIINGKRYHSDVRACMDQNDMDCFQEDSLTDRENEIVDLIVKGYSSNQISDILGISKWTVDSHRTNIRKKLGVSNVVDLVRFVLRTNERKNRRE
jgi:two-component system invasion response regulator UvrY